MKNIRKVLLPAAAFVILVALTLRGLSAPSRDKINHAAKSDTTRSIAHLLYRRNGIDKGTGC